MRTDPSDSANPRPYMSWTDSEGNTRYDYNDTGLTKREMFAAMALQGYIASGAQPQLRAYHADVAVKWADALIEELNK